MKKFRKRRHKIMSDERAWVFWREGEKAIGVMRRVEHEWLVLSDTRDVRSELSFKVKPSR
jgi:hypothetical protein